MHVFGEQEDNSNARALNYNTLQLTNQFPSLLCHETPQVTWHLPLNHLGPTMTKKVLPVMSLAITMVTVFLPSLLRLGEEVVTCMVVLFPRPEEQEKG